MFYGYTVYAFEACSIELYALALVLYRYRPWSISSSTFRTCPLLIVVADRLLCARTRRRQVHTVSRDNRAMLRSSLRWAHGRPQGSDLSPTELSGTAEQNASSGRRTKCGPNCERRHGIKRPLVHTRRVF